MSTQYFAEELSDVPLVSLQDGVSLCPVVRLLGDRRCQEAGQTQRYGYSKVIHRARLQSTR